MLARGLGARSASRRSASGEHLSTSICVRRSTCADADQRRRPGVPEHAVAARLGEDAVKEAGVVLVKECRRCVPLAMDMHADASVMVVMVLHSMQRSAPHWRGSCPGAQCG